MERHLGNGLLTHCLNKELTSEKLMTGGKTLDRRW
jgi:hypothetical protein